MSRALAQRTTVVRSDGGQLSDSATGSIRAGLIILFLFFGCFGGWAAIAPLNAAVVGDAVVKVEGNRKSVQHLDGGVVKELRVREGDTVAAGDVLIVLDDTIARLQAFEQAGADVLYAPGLANADEIRAVCSAVSKPVNVLARPSLTMAEIAEAGGRRVSVGGALTWTAVGAFVEAATAIRDRGDFSSLGASSGFQDWLS